MTSPCRIGVMTPLGTPGATGIRRAGRGARGGYDDVWAGEVDDADAVTTLAFARRGHEPPRARDGGAPGLHPRPRGSRDHRGGTHSSRAGARDHRHRRLLTHHRRAVERRVVRSATGKDPRRRPLPSGCARGADDHGGVRDLHRSKASDSRAHPTRRRDCSSPLSGRGCSTSRGTRPTARSSTGAPPTTSHGSLVSSLPGRRSWSACSCARRRTPTPFDPWLAGRSPHT